MNLLTTAIVLAMLATVAALGVGIVSMVRGGEFDREHASQYMFARVGFQGLTLALLLVALLAAAL